MRTLNTPLLLFMLTLALVTCGIVAVYSASASSAYLTKQLLFAGIGLAAMLFCYAIDYHVLKRASFWLMLVAFGLCCLVLVPGIGNEVKGARRWLALGPISIQPSELAKLALIIYMAKMLSERRAVIKSFFSGVFPALVVTGAFAAIIVIEPDFGAAFVLCLITFGMWLAAEMRWFHLVGLVLAAVPAALVAFLSEPYRAKRLIAFMFRDKETLLGAGWQLHQSLIAIGSGGLWGLGLGESRQKFHYLSEAHTDFIFAIMAEELGFVAMSCIVGMFLLITVLGWKVAWRTTDLFGSLLATGVTLMVFIGASINMCVVLGLLPTKGLVLPFISAGGSSLIVCMAAMGILMNVAASLYHHQGARAVTA
ncbi:MAG TPA: putative lipid II flippase FtsW [Candidatus Sumerlaeota bacterium]|nr:MAG: Lipid II flippase FtsW [candidate division BRC1 bacterium ADurb.BinA292]HOE95409.1 putative lipid II flippase FtsW [Candidatus Sumerlaeota bacterium]HOR29381.1 putative lipid II flippase FtsW [Candidatus Sumerlaeota bacterium]HPK02112.1 putative lipid II flippase FtsW [Candidatus Sumerlaeota bacterium]